MLTVHWGHACFLQERVGSVEKQKSELLMQQALMQQGGSQMLHPGHFAPGLHLACIYLCHDSSSMLQDFMGG